MDNRLIIFDKPYRLSDSRAPCSRLEGRNRAEIFLKDGNAIQASSQALREGGKNCFALRQDSWAFIFFWQRNFIIEIIYHS